MPVIIRNEQPIPTEYLSSLLVAGVDEAGRGPLAGPVVAAAVILDKNTPIQGLDDSKKLSPKQRDRLDTEIREKAIAWSVAAVTAPRIDEINILNATFEAMNQAIDQLGVNPEWIMVDGNRTPGNMKSMVAVIKGDQRVECISAASVVAKVYRDNFMLELDRQYPEYGFARHKGYPTKFHMQALEKYGPLEFHRMSYAPVARLAGSERSD